jgi:hypothetical protein
MSEAETKPTPRSKFTQDEDNQLRNLVAEHGLKAWVEIATSLPGRNPRQCRERWKHYLSIDQSSAPWTEEEDTLLFEKVSELGPKWTRIAALLGNRTDIELKTRWLQKFNHILRLFPKSGRTPGLSLEDDPVQPEHSGPHSPVQPPQPPTAELLPIVAPANTANLSHTEQNTDFLSQLEAVWGPFP